MILKLEYTNKVIYHQTPYIKWYNNLSIVRWDSSDCYKEQTLGKDCLVRVQVTTDTGDLLESWTAVCE